MKRLTRQAALNVDRFSDLPEGAFFCTYGRAYDQGDRLPGAYHLHERYRKIDAETVEGSDGRRWPLASTEASGCGVVLVPDGARSIVPFDARANGQYVEIDS